MPRINSKKIKPSESCSRAAFFVLLTFSLVSVLAISCKKESTPDKSSSSISCDTLQVSYSKTIAPILQQHCYSCHSGPAASAGLRLEQYSVVKSLATDGINTLVNSVNGNPDFTYMPPTPNAKLNSCEINKLQAWVNQGVLNN